MTTYKSDIESQIENDKSRRQKELQRDRAFCKTHFGPEETPDRALAFEQKEQRNREIIRSWLNSQMQVGPADSGKTGEVAATEGLGAL